jgi:hypothetical protein
MKTRIWVALLGLVVVASVLAVVLIHHQREQDREATNRGALTTAEYARAVEIAQSEIKKDHATVSQAVAYVVEGRLQSQNLPGTCTSGRLLVVSLVGDFPTIGVSPDPDAPSGPDMWVTVKADPATGDECLAGVSLGRFKATAGSVNLSPAL